jgi:hypothetical protein
VKLGVVAVIVWLMGFGLASAIAQSSSRGKLGVTLMTDTWRGNQPSLDSSGPISGAKVTSVSAGSAAEKAGLRPYDLVIRFMDVPIKDASALAKAVASAPVGAKLPIAILREGKSLNVEVELGVSDAGATHWIETYVLAQGGCGFLEQHLRHGIVLRDASHQARSGRRIDQMEFFGKQMGSWSDDDLDTALSLFRTCVERNGAEGRGHWKRSPVSDSIYNEGERNLLDAIGTARNQTASRIARDDARIQAEQKEAQRKREESAEQSRARQEKLRNQAQRDREAAEEAQRLAESEAPKIAEAAKEAEDARRAREAAEQKLSEIRSRISAEQKGQREALSQAQAAETAARQESQKKDGKVEAIQATGRNGSQVLFIEIRRDGNVYCAADGPAWVLLQIDGEFVALNGAARSWAGGGHMRVYQAGQWLPVHVRNLNERGLSVDAVSELIGKGNRACPISNHNLADEMFRRVQEGGRRFQQLGPRFGLSQTLQQIGVPDDAIEVTAQQLRNNPDRYQGQKLALRGAQCAALGEDYRCRHTDADFTIVAFWVKSEPNKRRLDSDCVQERDVFSSRCRVTVVFTPQSIKWYVVEPGRSTKIAPVFLSTEIDDVIFDE